MNILNLDLNNLQMMLRLCKMTFAMSNKEERAGEVARGHVLLALPREDLDLIVELVLQSGSLKGLAKAYSVSYPTIRNRIDKVIERLRDAVDGREPDPFRELLATLVERGELSTSAAKRIHDAALEQAKPGKHAPGASTPQSSAADTSTPSASTPGASTQGGEP